ncbi:S-layer homology domain-containing protein [Flavonifractor sp. An10]|uniref:S-layer homology domain-containing protein n=1 Tax=Flavonifractor sp. An10 TaxID=1965537 RepID=UPI000B37E737|nr:S-layer homology domain-containing protein [Flavonifractor sp. An10]OUQ82739.1 hypothetical protein B5E42_08615 [Flavonifractor sp. An10]
MRNLKRALSLVLAAAMLIGMMVVSASAVSYNDFSDRGEIVNKDAVSMLTTLEIIEGKPDGSYAPGENVDRAQMAKMISVMLSNNQNCDDLYMNVNSGLTDISANWAKGYINYCYTLGVIAGRGNGTFDPSANVTAVEAAKMLLTALGYEAEIEGLVGDDWALNTAALAHELGIFRNFDKDVSAPLNRDDAALLIYNAMDVEMIEQYQNGYALSYADHRTILSYVFGVIRVEGVVVANEWAQLQQTDSDEALREGRTTLANVVWYDSTTSNTRVEEGVKETEPVTFNVTTPVEYMGKAVTMYVEKTTILANSKVLGVATDDEANVINFTAATEDTVKDYLKGTGVAVNDDETEYYVNYGYFKNEEDAIDWINEYYYTEAQGNDFNLNGIEVQVIDNDDDGIAEYVLYLQETLSEVARYNATKETVSFYTPERDENTQLAADGAHNTVTIDLADMVSAEDVSLEGVTPIDALELEAEDLILYVQYGGRTYISLPEIVTGTMTRVDRDKDNELYITVNDEEYRQSFILDAASLVDVDVTRFDIDDAKEMPGFDTAYDFILDSHGYVVALRPAEEIVTNYALVLDSAWTQNALTRGGEVKILMADGTENTYDINWKESAKAFEDIDKIDVKTFADSASNDTKLEYYLGSRDVVQDEDGNVVTDAYKTGRAAGSIITYSLNEAGDELTIESVLQGNTFANDDAAEKASLEIDDDTNVKTTAGVADNGTVIFMDGNPINNDNLQYTTTSGYDNGYGRITVAASDLDDGEGLPSRQGTKTYAVDLDTVAFYYYLDDKNTSSTTDDEYVYGVATGWDKMSDVDRNTDVQVYPVLEKKTDGTYVASDLAGVILFEAEPDTVAADYMLVLSANAIGKDTLELNVVFEDGTAETIKVDDEGDYFDKDNDYHYMKAWSYSENADGTYDIGTMWNTFGVADLLINRTIALNDGTGVEDYLSLPTTANVWDVTEVEKGGDDVSTGTFHQNVYVNTVAIVSEGQVRTAWIWDLDEDDTTGLGYNFNWDLTNYVDIWAGTGMWAEMEIYEAYRDGKNILWHGDMTLNSDLVIPEGIIFQVDGDVVENNHSITGAGTFRVTGDYTVDNTTGDNNSTITVPTQVGGNLYLTEDTTTKARIGVYGSILDADKSGDHGYVNDLTVNSSVYVRGDVNVDTLTVNGHLEATNYHIQRGAAVYSDNTLVASGDLLICSGGLTIGNTSDAGVVTVYGDFTVYGGVDVVNGTLNLANATDVSTTGDITVGSASTKGYIKQTNGIIRNMDVNGYNVVINNGEVSLPGTIIDANSVTVNKNGVLTVTVKPDGYNESSEGTLNANGTGSTEEPVVSDLKLESVTVKEVKVTLNQSTKTGTVTLSATEAGDAPIAVKDVVAKANDEKAEVEITANGTNSFNIRLVKEGSVTVTYTIAVTVLEKSDNTDVSSITVKGVAAKADAKDATKYTVELTYEQAINTTEKKVEVTPADKNADVVAIGHDTGKYFGLGGNEWESTAALKDVVDGGSSTIKFKIEAENGTESDYYYLTVVVSKQPAQKANVTLYSDNKSGAVGELTGSDDAYTLLVDKDVDVVTGTHLANRVSGKGTTSSDIANVISTATPKDGVFTLTFKGIQEGKDQVITVTVKSANGEERVDRDKALIADGLDSLKAYEVTNQKVTEKAIKDEIEKQIKAMAKWGSDVKVSFSNEPDWDATTGTGAFSYTVDVTVTLTSDKGDVDGSATVTDTVTLRVSYDNTTR